MTKLPFELNLDWLVDFDKPHFNGREALLKEQKNGSAYRLVKLDIEGNKPAEESYLYSDKGCKKRNRLRYLGHVVACG